MWTLLAAAAVFMAGISLYNKLIKLREWADAAWADVDVQLKRRHDLIPNVVENVKGYAAHEAKTFEAVVATRFSAITAETPTEKGNAEGMLTGTLKSLVALVESYPELSASVGFRNLEDTLINSEESIQGARQYYNSVVRDFNTRISQVPTNIIANSFNFREREVLRSTGGRKGRTQSEFQRRYSHLNALLLH
jgi:LemA protein